ncbi:creatininase [Candidatus Moduliflexus flocculans]|uniref:Creatininase n=1 Tax=Candidatus Moduliflexus flocculans TaxID=1499966 RepID=A0A081BN45_9BACT|nr:creatininase [Candidatus Moduliflexus flocculans]
MRLEDFTWEDAAAYLRQHDGLIIPIGICEQHSTHLPLNTDTLVVEFLADYLSQETGLLVAPTVAYGVGLPCDRVYPGSSSILYEDLRNAISSLICWWKLQGFARFFLLTAHGDMFHLKALRETKQEHVFVCDLYDVEIQDILDKQTSVKHACEAETSVMLYLFPEKVRRDRIQDFETPSEEFQAYLQHLKDTPIQGSPGCQGHPSSASAEKGAQIVARIKAHALEWIHHGLFPSTTPE